MRAARVIAVVAVAGLAACGSGQLSSASAPPSAPPASAVAPSPGPFQITPLYCGKFSSAQVARYDDYSGLIFRYANRSNDVRGFPILSVNFTTGSQVAGSNVNGAAPSIGPGQSATADVGAVGDSGQQLRFTHCQMVFYTVDTVSGGPETTTYSP